MKKTIATLSLLMAGLFAQHEAQAQYVTLPDTNFRNRMRLIYPECFNAVGDLDTVAAANAENSTCDISGLSSQAVTGIHYFKNIIFLSFTYNTISTLPRLPYNLQILSFTQANFLTPSELIIPTSVKQLEYISCNLSVLPTLPSGLTAISLRNNPNLNFSSLPPLPNNNFSQIDLSYNNLSEYPSNFIGQQGSLQNLYLNNNQLTSLPNSLELGGDVNFNVNYNQLTSISSGHYYALSCSNNQITSLNGVSVVNSLNCSNNPNLTCLPYLNPYYFQSLNISGTGITCLPNKPVSLNSNLPICNPTNNPNSCPSFPYAIKGKAYKDLNNNGSYEDNEPIVNAAVKVNGHSWVGYSYNNEYQVDIDTAGSYNISLASSLPYWTAIISPTTPADLYMYGDIATRDIRLVANQTAKDLWIYQSLGTSRPGFNNTIAIIYQNIGTVSANATVKFLKPAGFSVDSASVSGYTASGDTLIWNVGNLDIDQKGVILIYGKIATNVALGTELAFNSWVNMSDTQEQTPTNNHSLATSIVTGSFDPNDKQAREAISPAQIAAGEYIDYTIRFQNTGTDTAFTVVIADTLESNLQANTLEMVASSHNVRTSMKGNVVYFEHLNILLPDSNVNEKASHGFVSFRIKPQTNLALGTNISNKAAIYFDYNAPVITNTAVTKVQNPTGIFDKINKTLATYPNPVDKGVLYVPNMVGASATLTSLEGKALRNWSAIGESISLEGIAQGMYLLKVTQKGETRTAKVMVK